MKRLMFVLSMLSWLGSMAHAQTLYTYVQQDGVRLEPLGTAAFDVSETPTVEFDTDKACMIVNGHVVAALPMTDGGELVVNTASSEGWSNNELNKVIKSPSPTTPYVTIFSPFQLVCPSGCSVYAPEYDKANQVLRLTPNNKIKAGEIIPAETALTIAGTSNVEFGFSTTFSTCSPQSSLSGTSLAIPTPTGGSVFTYGIGKDGPHKGLFGLFRYTGTSLNPGLCYLNTDAYSNAKYIGVNIDDETTGIDELNIGNRDDSVCKYVVNGRVIIKKGNKKYNLSGLELR